MKEDIMSERTVQHADFVIERRFDATPARVFRAFADAKAKALWFHGPDEWIGAVHEMDFRVGGSEISRAGPVGGPVHSFEARYLDIVPERRIVYSYDLHLDDFRMSVSLATIELRPDGKGTKLVFTEQGAFFGELDDPAGREHGTRELLDTLGATLGTDPDMAARELTTRRLYDWPRETVFEAFSDPERLARWWGPAGFSNSFHDFEFRPGGAWRFIMHGPDGTDYRNESVFVEVERPERIVFDHLSNHLFRMFFTLTDRDGRTELEMRMRFPTEAEREKIKDFVKPANEQNLDRLQAELARLG
jgi:uncharacterized protein YndB with AHSA1/START domain